ncbi:MAG: MATE family efflux transporter [Oscillospiraceae bacterium]
MEQLKENKMGTMPIARLLASVSGPIVVSMLVQALYNVFDSVFVAFVSENALTAVSLAFPVQNLMIAVSVGTGVGVNSLLSRRLGEKNFEAVNRIANNAVFVTLLNWLAFALLGGLFSQLYYNLVVPMPAGATAAQQLQIQSIRETGASYLFIVTVFSPGLFFSITLERLLQATGRSVFSMATQLSGAMINFILDPIMILGLFGFPRMGAVGGAISTVIGQFLGMLVGLALNLLKNPDIHLRLRGFRPHRPTIGHIYRVGLPSIVVQSVGSVMVFFMNLILAAFSTTAVAVLGIYFKLQSFVFLPVFGCNNGMISIVAFNYGAGHRARVEKTIRLNLLVCFCIMLAGTLLFWLAPALLFAPFNPSPLMLEIGVNALRLISLCFPAAAVSIVFSGVFQALGRASYSLVMSVVRQLVFILPLAWLLARLGGLHTVWYSFAVAELASLALAIAFFHKIWKEKIRPLAGPSGAPQPGAPLPESLDIF